MFPKIGGKPQNGWFRMETLLKLDDLGVPLFLETSIYQDYKEKCMCVFWRTIDKDNSNIYILRVNFGAWLNWRNSCRKKKRGLMLQHRHCAALPTSKVKRAVEGSTF